MKTKSVTYLLSTCLAITFLFCSFLPPARKKNPHKTSDAASELKMNMRKLWSDHVIWTRSVVLNIIDDLPGTEEAVKRLLKNQDDIGNAIKPYYGEEAGKQLTSLLYTHINQAAELLKAAKKDDNKKFDEMNAKWKMNADSIGTFLSKANPNWKEEEMKKMMQEHLSVTLAAAVARKKKDYAGDVAAFDKVHDQILHMSDMLSDGIIKQFPEKFKDEKASTSKK